MKRTSPDDIKAMVKHLGTICLLGEQHGLAGTMPPGMCHGYADKDELDAYRIGLERTCPKSKPECA